MIKYIRYFLNRFIRLMSLLIFIRIAMLILFNVDRSIQNIFFNGIMYISFIFAIMISLYDTYRYRKRNML